MTEVIRIEKDIPMARRIKLSKYPFPQMQVGDSFAYPCGLRSAQHITARANSRFPGRTYVSRLTEDGQQVRIWRTR